MGNIIFKQNVRNWMLILILLMTFSFMSAGSASAAVMPTFERLTPVSSNLTAPTSVAIDSNECIFVAESINNRVQVFSQSGLYKGSITGLNRPISVAVDGSGKIYVGNKDAGSVGVYDSDYNYLYMLGQGSGEFSKPGAIAVSGAGNIYVADGLADVVKVYNSSGTLISSFGSTGSGNGQFNNPTAIAIDEVANEIIITDRQLTTDMFGAQIAGSRVQVFDINGNYQRNFGEYGVGEGLIKMPLGVAVDSISRIYVTDAAQNVVHVFDNNGIFLGTLYDLANPLRTPLAAVAGDSNRLFIASLNSRTVEIYGLDSYSNMNVTPVSISFQGDEGSADPAGQTFEISNNGLANLDWSASTNDSWIVLSSESGSIAPDGNENVTVDISLEGLEAGIFVGSINVSSPSGATEVINVDLTVFADQNPLEANPGGPYSGTEGIALTLNAVNSGGNIVLYEWDIDDDGTYEYSSASHTQNHMYNDQGTYTVRLRVTDDGGDIDEATTTAEIDDSAPTADFTASQTGGIGSITVNFTNNSTGHDQPLTYAWDFEDDGSTDSTDESPAVIFEEGSYTVKLTVTDSDGTVNSITKTDYIVVEAGETCPNLPVLTGGVYYGTLQEAYNNVTDGGYIQSHASNFNENLTINRDISVTFVGGYDCNYSSYVGQTRLNGNLTLESGTFAVEYFEID